MLNVTCSVAAIRPFAKAASMPIRLAGVDPGQFLSSASSTLTGANALSLNLDYSRFNQVPVAPRADLPSLHIALRLLTLNPTSPGIVNRIGLLLADRFAPRPTVLGMMFDAGFQSGVSDPSFNAVPREGCALFLDAILALRGPGPAYEQEVAFTAAHEIGHIFNLWHVPSPPNLMAQSPAAGPFGPQAFFFVQPHARFLSLVEGSHFVAPGGSDWGQRGTLGPPGDNPFNEVPRSSEQIRMWINTSHQECWAFEPVELNVRLSSKVPVRLPDIVDPGYDEFNIWIEAPNGHRRRYRPVALYCGNTAGLNVAPGTPFTRDISIWGESGGYTFFQNGVHKVTCTLKLGERVIRSNRAEFFIKPAALRNRRYESAMSVLSARANARLLFYKSGRKPFDRFEPLCEVTRRFRRSPTAANIQYSLGHALVRNLATSSGTNRQRPDAIAAERVLKSALDSGQLSSSRRRRAADLLDELEQR